MASPGEDPWHDTEKLFLLAEILKDAQIPVSFFCSIIADMNIQPRWEDIPLPSGRSLRSCQRAFGYLMADPSLTLTASALTNAPHAVLPGSGKTPNPRKRPLPKDNTAPGARSLQPRPPHPSVNGNDHPMASNSPHHDPTQLPKRKRGRPSKADQEARAAAAAARGEPLPPPKPPKPKAPPKSPKSAAEQAQLPGGRPLVGSMPNSAQATPEAPRVRRGRPTKAESEAKRLLLQATTPGGNGHHPPTPHPPPPDPSQASHPSIYHHPASAGHAPPRRESHDPFAGHGHGPFGDVPQHGDANLADDFPS